MKVTITKKGSPFKPRKEQSEKQYYRDIIAVNKAETYNVEELTVEEFAWKCANGFAWRAGIFKEKNGEIRFRDSYVDKVGCIALDFDSTTVAPEEIVEYAESIGIPANFYYYSYSQNPEVIDAPEEAITSDKLGVEEYLGYSAKYKENYNFRIVWCFKEPIEPKTHLEIYETLVNYIFKDFQGVDTSTRNPQQLFFGGNSYAVVVNPEETSVATLGWGKILEAYNSGLSNKGVHKRTAAGAKDWEEIEAPDAVVVGSKWMDWLKSYCPLLAKWMRQEYIDYNQRLALWSNLRYIKRKSTATSITKDLMAYYKPEVWKGHTFSENEIKGKFRDSHLKPAPIVKYGGSYITVPEFFKQYNNLPTIVDKNKELVELKELDAWMRQNVGEVIGRKGLDYFQSQTASGKTELYIDALIKEKLTIGKVVLAVPFHTLAKEIEERFLAKDKDFPVYRISEREYTPLDLMRMRLGLQAQSKSADVLRGEKFKALMSYDTFGVFIITHSLLVHLGHKIPASSIIIDENIEQALIKEVKITIPQLGSLMAYLPQEKIEVLADYIEELNEAQFGEEVSDRIIDIVNSIDLANYINDVNDDTCIDGLFLVRGAVGFRKSTKNGKACLRALIKSEMITNAIECDIPVKLFTATPMSQRLKNYYGVSFNVVRGPQAVNQGKVKQYRGYTGARGVSNGRGMDNEHFKMAEEYIKAKLTEEEIKASSVISFYGSSERWRSAGFEIFEKDGKEIHLLNNAGLDFMKGKNIIVVGKPDRPDEFYLDLWMDIGDGTKPHKSKQKIFLNGVWQTLYLWDKEELRNEQLQWMEYTTQQAIGRARALRTDATVYLFSNYVPKGVDEVYD